MIRSSIYSRTLRVLGTNSTAYLAADFNNDLNEALALRTMEILRLKGYKYISQTHAYTNFVSITGLSEGDNGFNGEYALPTDLLDIERIEITFDGTNWYVISKENGNLYDISESGISEQDKTTIQNNYSKSNPQATILRGSMFIRPLNDGSTVSNGLRIFYSPRQTELDEDSDSPDFESNLHQALIYDCAEIEMLSHPASYDTLKEGRVLRKKVQVDKEFSIFYRTRIKSGEQVNAVKESFK
jgi:hypothetical protein